MVFLRNNATSAVTILMYIISMQVNTSVEVFSQIWFLVIAL